jgi:uncharacterized protein YndB with AHSA1/START domain
MLAEASIVIDRPPQVVWQLAVDPRSMDRWLSPARKNGRVSVATQGQFGVVGGTIVRTYIDGETEIASHRFELTAWDPPRHIALRSAEADKEDLLELRLEPYGEGTLVTLVEGDPGHTGLMARAAHGRHRKLLGLLLVRLRMEIER